MEKFINKKGVLDQPYRAGFGDKRINLYARSEAAAKQKAVEHFRPKRKDAEQVWVHLT